jgi:hypothetical protein
VFEGDTGTGDRDPARLRSVGSKRVGLNSARHQVSGIAALEDLDVNVRGDLVNGVTGIPRNQNVWGAGSREETLCNSHGLRSRTSVSCAT